MVDTGGKQPRSKQRRLRAPEETVRTKAEKARIEADKPAKARRGRKFLRALFKPFKIIFRPLIWLLKRITPRYFVNAFKELRQVTWPNRRQSRQLTTAVILFSTAFAIAISVLDYGLNIVFKKVFLKQ